MVCEKCGEVVVGRFNCPKCGTRFKDTAQVNREIAESTGTQSLHSNVVVVEKPVFVEKSSSTYSTDSNTYAQRKVNTQVNFPEKIQVYSSEEDTVSFLCIVGFIASLIALFMSFAGLGRLLGLTSLIIAVLGVLECIIQRRTGKFLAIVGIFIWNVSFNIASTMSYLL